MCDCRRAYQSRSKRQPKRTQKIEIKEGEEFVFEFKAPELYVRFFFRSFFCVDICLFLFSTAAATAACCCTYQSQIVYHIRNSFIFIMLPIDDVPGRGELVHHFCCTNNR